MARFTRPSREKIDLDVRNACAERGIPCVRATHDGPPVFDRFHEALVTRIAGDLDEAWDRAVATQSSLYALCLLTTLDTRFDLSDVSQP